MPSRSLPPYKFDAARWSQADRIAGVATAVLFISLFLPWFGASFGAFSVAVNGLWHGWMYLVLILCLILFADLVLRAGWETPPIKLPISHGVALLSATTANFVLTLIAFLDNPGNGVGWRFGAFVGLVASVVAVVPFGLPIIRSRTS